MWLGVSSTASLEAIDMIMETCKFMESNSL